MAVSDIGRPVGLAARLAAYGDTHPISRTLLLCVVVFCFALPWQMRWGTIPDTSWLIHTCERILAGDRLYVDIIETNPPFSIWLYMPVVWLAAWTGIPAEALAHAYAYLSVLLGLGFAAFILSRARFSENSGLLTLSPLILALFVIFPGSALTECEHMGTALLLPLLALTAWRATGGRP